MTRWKNEVTCIMIIFVQDISNVKNFLSGIDKYDVNKKGVYWRSIHNGLAIEVSFVTTIDCVEQIKKDYEELAYKLIF